MPRETEIKHAQPRSAPQPMPCSMDPPVAGRVTPPTYTVTVSDCVDTGPAPAPGNADPTPLNITRVTVYRPGRRYTCVADAPEPVVPSPNSHRYVITGCALTLRSAEKRTGCPAGACFGANVNPGVVPLWPVVTMPPLPVDLPSLAMMVRPTE